MGEEKVIISTWLALRTFARWSSTIRRLCGILSMISNQDGSRRGHRSLNVKEIANTAVDSFDLEMRTGPVQGRLSFIQRLVPLTPSEGKDTRHRIKKPIRYMIPASPSVKTCPYPSSTGSLPLSACI